MKDLLKLALLAAGGYYLFYQLTERSAAASTPAPNAGGDAAPVLNNTPTPPAPPPSSPEAPANPPAAPPALTLEQKIRAASRKVNASDTMTYDQWNYYFQQVTGTYGPAIEDVFPGLIRSAQMTYAEFAHGLSKFGLGRVRQNRLW